MSLVVLLFGASGSGKSTLLEQLLHANSNYSIHIKATDRSPREYDGIEIKCVESVSSNEYDYIYSTYGFRYGIQKSQIENAIVEGKHHFIICNDIPTIEAIRRDYGKRVRVVFHHFDAPREALQTIQAQRGISDDEIDLRLAKIDNLYRTFVEEQELFDGVLHNHYGEPPAQGLTRMRHLLVQMIPDSHDDLADRIVSKVAAVIQQQISDQLVTTAGVAEPNYVFVIMAMSQDDPLLEDTHETIKRVGAENGYRAERVDDIQFTGQITEKMLGSIRRAQFVIADLTAERPNVYYEVGYAHALGKPILLTARAGTKLHFDVQGMRVLYYRNMSELSRELGKTLAHFRRSE